MNRSNIIDTPTSFLRLSSVHFEGNRMLIGYFDEDDGFHRLEFDSEWGPVLRHHVKEFIRYKLQESQENQESVE